MWAARSVFPDRSPTREPPRHQPATRGLSGTASCPSRPVETAWTGTTRPLGSRSDRGASETIGSAGPVGTRPRSTASTALAAAARKSEVDVRCRIIASSRAKHPNGEVAGQPNRPGVHIAGGGSATVAQRRGVHDRAERTGGGTTRRVDHRHSARGDGDFQRTEDGGCRLSGRHQRDQVPSSRHVNGGRLTVGYVGEHDPVVDSYVGRHEAGRGRDQDPTRPALIGWVGVGDEVTNDSPRTAAGRWRTTSTEEPGLSQTVVRTTLPPEPTKANTCRPAGSRTGPMTSPRCATR